MKDAKTIFNEALDLIRDPKRWTQEAFGRTQDGTPVMHVIDWPVVCWCSMGALEQVGGVTTFRGDKQVALVVQQLSEAARSLGGHNIDSFNDNHTHPEVIALWEKVGREQGWME